MGILERQRLMGGVNSFSFLVVMAVSVSAATSAAGCHTSEPEEPPPPPMGSPMCGGLAPIEICYPSAELIRVGGNFSPPGLNPMSVLPVPPQLPHLDQHGCMTAQDVTNSCCLGAFAGPRFDGRNCCYMFCTAGGCC